MQKNDRVGGIAVVLLIMALCLSVFPPIRFDLCSVAVFRDVCLEL